MSKKTLLVLGIVVAVAVVLWYLRRRDDRSTAAGQDIPVDEESQQQADPSDQQPSQNQQSYEIAHDPTDPLGADEQALHILYEDGVMRNGGG